ncbi:MAG: extracellular solute-binding protein [Firmicutes bacterium]|nr:extracellular solute-binding protein [Bacillota bacterium]
MAKRGLPARPRRRWRWAGGVMAVGALLGWLALAPSGPELRGLVRWPGQGTGPRGIGQGRPLVLWEASYPAAGGAGTYEAWVRQGLAEFSLSHPGVTVEVRFFPPSRLGPALEQALAQKRPPDVFHVVDGRAWLSAEWQEPVTRLFRRDAGAYHPAVAAAVSRDGQVWAWPQGMTFRLLAANIRLLQKAGVDVRLFQERGWTWEEFAALARRLSPVARTAADRYAVLLQAETAEVPEAFLAASGWVRFADDSGQFTWSRDALSRLASLVKQMQREKLLPPGGVAAQYSTRMLTAFWQGETALVGPVGPWLLDQARRRRWSGETVLPERYALAAASPAAPAAPADQVAFLPIPHLDRPAAAAGNPLAATAHAYAVFRSDPRFPDRQRLQLAQMLARHLAQFEAAHWAALVRGLPAYLPALAVWQSQDVQGEWPVARVLLAGLNRLQVQAPAPEELRGIDVFRRQLLEAWRQLLAEDGDPGRFVSQVMTAGNRLWPQAPPPSK